MFYFLTLAVTPNKLLFFNFVCRLIEISKKEAQLPISQCWISTGSFSRCLDLCGRLGRPQSAAFSRFYNSSIMALRAPSFSAAILLVQTAPPLVTIIKLNAVSSSWPSPSKCSVQCVQHKLLKTHFSNAFEQ